MKKTVLFVMLLLCVSSVFAQNQEGWGRWKNNTFFIGPKAGVTFSTMTQPNECDLYDGAGVGFSAGLAAKVRFGRKTQGGFGHTAPGTGYIGLGAELKYVQNAMKTIVDENLKLGYLEVPVFVQVFPFVSSEALNGLSIELGAAVEGSISSSPDNMTMNTSATYVSYAIGDLKGWDVRPLVGVNYAIPCGKKDNQNKVPNNLEFNARYYIGTSELAGNFPCKVSHLEVSVAWMFSCGKF
jgi:hypothetical protein